MPKDKIAEFCRRHGVRRLALFGSVLRVDFDVDSDIDVLVEFRPDVRVGLSFFLWSVNFPCYLAERWISTPLAS
ncbi:MAG TPA: nucleotidyltransferase domain-containing protein [Desulfomonilaceae bacterium]|nr:nucleotidyltransferase domain-containing protein [Desulfomonilaceae bacterium]